VSFEQYFPVVLVSTSSKVILSFERVEKRKLLSSFIQPALFYINESNKSNCNFCLSGP